MLYNRTTCDVSTDFSGVDIYMFGILKINERNNCRHFRRFRKAICKTSYCLQHYCQSVCVSARHISAPTGTILVKFGIGDFYWNLFTHSALG